MVSLGRSLTYWSQSSLKRRRKCEFETLNCSASFAHQRLSIVSRVMLQGVMGSECCRPLAWLA